MDLELFIVKVLLLLFTLLYILNKESLQQHTLLFISLLTLDRINYKFLYNLCILYTFYVLVSLLHRTVFTFIVNF